jgi:hypothetical protein
MVTSVGNLPREVWDKQSGMKSPPNKVVHLTIRRECTVATFVSKNPEANAYTSLKKSVEQPGYHTHARVWDTMDVRGAKNQTEGIGNVSEYI